MSTSSTRAGKCWPGKASPKAALSEAMMANPGPAIGEVIADMFAQYPGKAPQ